MSRQIIQIAATECGAENGYSRHLYALASDGTVWEIDRTERTGWAEVPKLPNAVETTSIERPFVMDKEAMNQEILSI